MQIWNTFLLVLRFWEIGSPSRVLLPCTCLLFAVLHGSLRWGTGRREWWLPCLLAAAILVSQIMIWLIHNYLALLIVVVMCYAEAALLGTVLGELVYRLWMKAGAK